MRSIVFFSAFLLFVSRIAAKKTVCVKRQFTVENTAFYQRIEILNALDCVERCIEAADSCRAVVYVEHSKKSFCQFYNVNSEERPADVKPVRTLEPTTTLFELLDVCAVEAAVHSRDFLSQLTPALKRILDGLPSGKRKNSKAQRELSFVVDDPHSTAADRSLIFGAHAERDEAVPNRETYVVRPEYPFDGQKSAGRKGTVGKAIQSDTDYTDLNANGGDGGAPVPRRLATSITPVRGGSGGTSGGGRNEVYSVGNPQPISPVLVSHGGVPQPRGGATNGGGGYAVSPSGYAATYNSIGRGTAGRLGQPFDCRTVPCEQPRAPISPAPCPPVRLPTDPCIPQSAGVERASAYWSEWAPTGVCSVTCGAGVRQRRRTCSSGNNADCSGEATKEEPCILPECNMWTAWSSWTGCSASCGGGTKSRTRACRNGRECVGPAEDVRDCGEEPCPYFSQWTSWGECSSTCGSGTQRRIRECISTGSSACPPGPTADHQPCELKPCPTWGPWERWSECSKSCGMGERVRKRECLNGLGDDCVGTNEDHMFCNQQTCPTGDEGTRLRSRQCTYEGIPSHDCPGAAQDQSACRLEPCPSWAEWGAWSSCSASCGHGQQKRTRECGPRGYGCTGGDTEIRFCQVAVCPYWDNWSEWTTCTSSCGRGMTERKRKCVKNDPLPGAVLPSEEELNANGGGGGGGGEALRPEPEQEDDSDGPTVDETGSLEANTESRPKNGRKLGKNAEAKDAIKARLIERAQALKNSTSKTASGRSVRRPLLREHTLEVAQSNSMPFADRRRAPLKASMLALRDVGPSEGCAGDDVERRECELGPCCDWGSWSSWTSCNDPCSNGARMRSRACQIQVTYALPAPTPLMSFIQPHHDYIPNGVQFGGGVRRRRQLYGQQPIANGGYPTASLFRAGASQFGFAQPVQQAFIPGAPFGAQQQTCECPGKAVESEQCEGAAAFNCNPQFGGPGGGPNGGRLSNREGGSGGGGRGGGRSEAGVARGLSEAGSADEGESRSGGGGGGRGRPKGKSGGVGASVELTDGKSDAGVRGGSSTRSQCSWGQWGAWNTCRGSCPKGTRARTRACKRPERTEETYSSLRRFARAADDQCDCEGENVDTQECKPKNCNTERDTPAIGESAANGLLSETDDDPVLSCYYSEWSDWSACAKNSTKRRTRLCVGLKALLTDCKCTGPDHQQANCEPSSTHSNKRPSEAVLEVSRAILRDRLAQGENKTDDRPAVRQLDAPTETVDTQDFKLKELSECTYLRWTEWRCDALCGAQGERRRTRMCPCVACEGDAEEVDSCEGPPCQSAINQKKYPFFH